MCLGLAKRLGKSFFRYVKMFRRVVRTCILMGFAGAVLFTLTACEQEYDGKPTQLSNSKAEYGFLPSEPGITNHTGGIIDMWVTSWIALLVVGIFVWGLIFWCIIAYRRRKDDFAIPPQTQYNLPVEVLSVALPVILIGVFYFFTQNQISSIQGKPDSSEVTVAVYGKRWSWDFNYKVNNNAPDDVKTHKPAEQMNSSELQRYESERAAVDEGWKHHAGKQVDLTPQDRGQTVRDEEFPVLYLPEGKSVHLQLYSRDVIHSFWVPAFLDKMDMIPNKQNDAYFTPMKAGVYEGKCAELCGEYHSEMLFRVVVLPEAQYLEKLSDPSYATQGKLGNEYNVNVGRGDGVTEDWKPSHSGNGE